MSLGAVIGDMAAGILLILFAMPRGPVRRNDDGWNRYPIW